MLLIGGLTAIGAGIFCFTDTELAWRLYELDHQMWGQHVSQPKNWRQWVYAMGTALMIMGMMAVALAFETY